MNTEILTDGTGYKQADRRPLYVRDGRAENIGPGALSDAEILAAILGGTQKAAEVGALLLTKFSSLSAVAKQRVQDLRNVEGVGEAGALRIVAAFEGGRRVQMQTVGERPVLDRVELIASYMQPFTAPLEVEKFFALCLDRKNRLLRRVEVTSGTATSALAHPREVFRAAIREAASAIVCVHNHPSGDPTPSAADVQVTHLLRDAARTLEISFLDHVIIGRASADPTGRGYYSFREAGLV